MRVGREMEDTSMRTDSDRSGKNGTKVVIDNVDGGHEGVGGDNGMEESVDGRAAVLVPTS